MATACADLVPSCRTLPTDPPLWAGILSLTCFFTSISVFGGLLPFFVEDVLGEPKTFVGVAISTYYAFATAGQFFTGFLSDIIGIRRTIIGACLANVLLLNMGSFG